MPTTVREYSGSGFPSGPITGDGTAAVSTALLIGSAWRPSSTGDTFATLNPANGQVLANVATASGADVDDAVAAARAAMSDPAWTAMPKPQLARLLWRGGGVVGGDAAGKGPAGGPGNGRPPAGGRPGRGARPGPPPPHF